MKLKNKKIIVTGGAGGIGSSIVKRLLKDGAIVAVVDWNKEKLAKLEKQIPAEKRKNIFYYNLDIGDFNSVKKMVDDFFDTHKEIDALINNAATLEDSLFVSVFKNKINKLSLESWEKTLKSNLYGCFYFSREVVEKMVLKRTKGVIINVSSISAAGNAGQSCYAASKAAMDALTVTWAKELSMFNIRVAGLAPGMTDTDMPKNAMGKSMLESWTNKTPMKRMGTPEEIAHGIIFILENDFFCGRILKIDGGLRM